jgi:hypothetical protein
VTEGVSLAEVLRYVVKLRRKPEAELRREILEALHSRRLPHKAERIVEYLPRPAGASSQKAPPTRIRRNAQIPKKVLAIGVRGRGSLIVDWQNSGMIRRAGRGWNHIEIYNITCDREQMLELWPSGKTELRVVVQEILRELFPPDGTPPADVSAQKLANKVNDELEKRGMRRKSIRTILRIAGVGKP